MARQDSHLAAPRPRNDLSHESQLLDAPYEADVGVDLGGDEASVRTSRPLRDKLQHGHHRQDVGGGL